MAKIAPMPVGAIFYSLINIKVSSNFINNPK